MKISIITVTKNNKPGLICALECVRNQTYPNIEHVIVDGGSTDGTVEILRQAQDDIEKSSLITDHNSLISISEPDNGIYDAINKGIKLAAGDVIGLLHSEDVFADEYVVAKYADVFNNHNVDSVYSDLVYVRDKYKVQKLVPNLTAVRQVSFRDQKVDSGSESGMTDQTYNPARSGRHAILRYWKTQKKEFTTEAQRHRALKFGWMPPHPTLFIKKDVFDRYCLYRTDMKIASDYEMILRLFYKHKIISYYLPVTTYFMTIGGASNKSPGNIIQKSKEDFQAMKLNGIPFPLITLLSKNLRKFPQFLARDL